MNIKLGLRSLAVLAFAAASTALIVLVQAATQLAAV